MLWCCHFVPFPASGLLRGLFGSTASEAASFCADETDQLVEFVGFGVAPGRQPSQEGGGGSELRRGEVALH